MSSIDIIYPTLHKRLKSIRSNAAIDFVTQLSINYFLGCICLTYIRKVREHVISSRTTIRRLLGGLTICALVCFTGDFRVAFSQSKSSISVNDLISLVERPSGKAVALGSSNAQGAILFLDGSGYLGLDSASVSIKLPEFVKVLQFLGWDVYHIFQSKDGLSSNTYLEISRSALQELSQMRYRTNVVIGHSAGAEVAISLAQEPEMARLFRRSIALSPGRFYNEFHQSLSGVVQYGYLLETWSKEFFVDTVVYISRNDELLTSDYLLSLKAALSALGSKLAVFTLGGSTNHFSTFSPQFANQYMACIETFIGTGSAFDCRLDICNLIQLGIDFGTAEMLMLTKKPRIESHTLSDVVAIMKERNADPSYRSSRLFGVFPHGRVIAFHVIESDRKPTVIVNTAYSAFQRTSIQDRVAEINVIGSQKLIDDHGNRVLLSTGSGYFSLEISRRKAATGSILETATLIMAPQRWTEDDQNVDSILFSNNESKDSLMSKKSGIYVVPLINLESLPRTGC